MLHKTPDFEKGIKIESVGMYLEKIKEINKNRDGDSTELFFRGQETEFWAVEPSIFREDMLSIEHKLMINPLQKVPMEFRNMQDTFEIMTKYQHYGMCTRLLDLTTNPLVALYFACKKHGILEYQSEDEEIENIEPFGVVLFKGSYPVLSDNISVRIITALSKRDLDKENDLESILCYLKSEGAIDSATSEFWMTEDNVEKFIELIQNNYLVMPLYSNERLIKQSGAFLLPGLFQFIRNKDLKKSILSKSKINLIYEFEESYFYIDGSDKESILQELNWYNINESTLFPELEHQLNYIKQNSRLFTKPVDGFIKYSLEDDSSTEVISNVQDESIELFNANVKEYITTLVEENLVNEIYTSLQENMIIDWYKRENIISKMKYTSTRDNSVAVSASRAIFDGISSDGGLYVPSSFPVLDKKEIVKLIGMSYPERAAYVMAKFLDDFTYPELMGYCYKAYSKFDSDNPCPLVNIEEGLSILELWHGPTHAFKDMALSVMPYLMTAAREKVGADKKSLILVATSGDTGKAALEGFADVPNTEIIVFYPFFILCTAHH